MSNAEADELERQSHKRRIGFRREARGWAIVPADTPRTLTPQPVIEYETAHGPADYALNVDGRILGVVEVKQLTIGSQNSLTQAERCSRRRWTTRGGQ